MDYFIDKMIPCLEEVEKAHIDILPTAFLSSVIDDCMEKWNGCHAWWRTL